MYLRHTLFTLIIVAGFFATAELLLALAGVRPLLLDEDPFVGFADNVPQFVDYTRPDGSRWLRTAANKRALFNPQEFPGDKPPGSYRIFCMGGSTTFGRPYFDEVSFCGWLRAYLKAADPARHWEVVNAGGVSFASYRVARLMNELRQYQPDLFIVYTGQNEFLEQRSYGALIDMPAWLLNLNATLSATRLYTAMAQLIDAVQPDSLRQAQARGRLSGEVDEILNHTIGPQSYHRDDQLQRRITTHFRLNLARMVRIARSVDAQILFVQPAINLKDMSPFKSEHRAGLEGAALARWQALYEEGAALEAGGDTGAALARWREALALDDRHAGLHYRIGRLLFARGEYAAAEQALRRAVDEDVAPLRILGSMQRSVAEVAAAEDVPLVDFEQVLRAAYRARGSEYFVDHVHTSKEGYRLLGLALFEHLVHAGVAKPDPGWNSARRETIEQQVLAGIDRRTEGMSLVNLGKVLGWAGKFEEAYTIFRRAQKVMGQHPAVYFGLASALYSLGRPDEALNYYKATLVLAPGQRGVHAELARIHAEQGNTDAAIEHCRAELELDPGNYRVHIGLAELLGDRDPAAARGHYRNALQLKPQFAPAHASLALHLIRQERYEEALAHGREALRLDPKEYRAHNALGLILVHQGQAGQAIEHFTTSLQLEPGNSTAEQNLRRLQADQQQAGSGDLS